MRDGEGDVKSIQAVLGITHSGVSQHLMTFRAHRLVSECRQVFYRLRQPELADQGHALPRGPRGSRMGNRGWDALTLWNQHLKGKRYAEAN